MTEHNNIKFSDEEIQSKVKQSGINSKITRYFPVLAIGGAWMVFRLELPFYFYLAAIGLFLMSPTNWVLRVFVFGKSLAKKLENAAIKGLEELSLIEIAQLRKKLEEYEREHAKKQLDQLEESFSYFSKILDQKYSKGRGYGQIKSAAEEMRGAGLQNLNVVVDNEEYIRILDVPDSEVTIKRLTSKKGRDKYDDRQIEDHTRQIELAKITEDGNRKLIAEIENTITALKEKTGDVMRMSSESVDSASINKLTDSFREVTSRNKRIYDSVSRAMKQMSGDTEETSAMKIKR